MHLFFLNNFSMKKMSLVVIRRDRDCRFCDTKKV